MFTGTPPASLHSQKEGWGSKRFHSGTRLQTFAVSGAPARRCHVKGRLNRKCFVCRKNLCHVNCPLEYLNTSRPLFCVDYIKTQSNLQFYSKVSLYLLLYNQKKWVMDQSHMLKKIHLLSPDKHQIRSFVCQQGSRESKFNHHSLKNRLRFQTGSCSAQTQSCSRASQGCFHGLLFSLPSGFWDSAHSLQQPLVYIPFMEPSATIAVRQVDVGAIDSFFEGSVAAVTAVQRSALSL